MKHWRIDEVAWDRFDPREGRSGDRPARQGRGDGRAQRHRLRASISTACSTTTRISGRPPTTGRSRKCSTATRSAAGRCWPIRPGTIAAAFARYKAGFKHRARCRRLDPRLAHRRADRPLHGRDRHLQLLHGAGRGDRRAGAAADLPADRGRRIPPLQAVLRPHAPLSGAREHRRSCSACASPPAASARARTTNSPSPSIAATSRHGCAYDHERCIAAYMARAMAFYRFRHIERGMGMIFKAVGLPPRGRLSDVARGCLAAACSAAGGVPRGASRARAGAVSQAG